MDKAKMKSCRRELINQVIHARYLSKKYHLPMSRRNIRSLVRESERVSYGYELKAYK